MKRAVIHTICFISALLSAGIACAQPAASFLAVDVYASAPNETREIIGMFPGSDRYEMRGITMVELISDAWGVNADRLAGGPAWLATNHYDFIAKVPPGYDGAKLKPLLQAALTERFGLAVHSDTRPASAFTMTAAKGGAKLKKSDGAGEGGCSSTAPEGFNAASGLVTYNCRHVTIPEFADAIQSFARGYFVGAPLVDHTNLAGAWDFTLQFSQRNMLLTPDAIPLFDATEKQLGLKIEAAKLPLPVIVVDKINEKPTETSPEAAKMLAGPTEFDLVVIKPSGPDSKPQTTSPFLPGGRFELHRASLQELIEIGWDIQGDNRIINAPAFLDKNAFDIVAKAPANGATSEMSLASMEVMIQSMLKDRFKLAAHTDERPGDVFALTAAKPKLKAADPSNRPDCKAAAATSTPIRNRLIICQNVTMALFASKLAGLAGGYFQGKPLFDATGLDGSFDFTVNFSGIAVWQRSVSAKGDAGDTADPTGAISLPDALQQQIGIKMESQKRPVPVVVIDHVEEMPTDN